MSNLVAIAYPDQATAQEVANTMAQLQKERSIELDDLVIAVRRDDGKIKLHQSFSPGASRAAGGALWGAADKGGVGTFGPRLDAAGSSVKGQLVARYLSEELGLDLLASEPAR